MPTRVTSTVVKEEIPTGQQAQPNPFYDRPFWEVISTIDWAKGDHVVRVYRADERWLSAGSPPENKFTEEFNEDTIRQRWGGGRYLLWLYGPPVSKGGNPITVQIGDFHVELEGQPKLDSYYRPPQNVPVRTDGNGTGDARDLLLETLIAEVRALRQGPNLMEQAFQQSMQIMATAYKSAATIVKSETPAGAAPGSGDLLRAEFEKAMIQRLVNPPDPTESLKGLAGMAGAVITAIKEIGGLSGGGAKFNVVEAIVGQLPALGEKVVATLHEQRLLAQEQTRQMQIQSGATRTLDVQPTAPPNPENAAAPAAPAEAPREPVVSLQDMVLLRLRDVIRNEPDATGEDIYDFLEGFAPPYIEQLKKLTREQIVEIFSATPILKEVASHPRLPKLIDEFLVVANKEPPSS